MSHYTYANLSDESKHITVTFFETIAFISESFVVQILLADCLKPLMHSVVFVLRACSFFIQRRIRPNVNIRQFGGVGFV